MVPNPALSRWFEGLRQPGTPLPCCAISDCRRVEYRMAGNSYQIRLEGLWYDVPSNIILRGKGNPVGAAVACYRTTFGYTTLEGATQRADGFEILCFVPELPTS
jgi:hypothetical protein